MEVMTKKEAISLLKLAKAEIEWEYPLDYQLALDKAIEALEQEPILDKIRAEIEQNAYPIVHGVNNHEKGMTLYGILQIIDKYKPDKED